jgi:hypothetical protein
LPIRSNKAIKGPFTQARNEESVPVSLAGDGKLEPEIKKYLGSAPILFDESEEDYSQFVDLVREQLHPTNILEEIWVMDYVCPSWEAQRLRRFKQKLLYTAVEDSVARVIRPFLHHDTLKVQLLARGWASRTPTAMAEVKKLLETAGLDREVIFAQIFADKLNVIEKIDLTIFRYEQRKNAALRAMQQWRDGLAERLRQAESSFEAARITRPFPGGAQRDPERTD